MKHFSVGILLSSLPVLAHAQVIENVYDRDTHAQFKLKKYDTKSIVKGPMVKQQSVFTFDNPAKKLTEASFWFSLPAPGVLGDFAYWYKDEFVPGVLMDKKKAWFIYTAITSRNEDPGIMVQTSPSSYHAQIFPLAVGYDLRVQLTSLNFLEAKETNLLVPEPQISIYDYTEVPHSNSVVVAQPKVQRVIEIEGQKRTVISDSSKDSTWLQYYAQKHKDGHTYVVGMIRTDRPDDPFYIRGLKKVFWTRPANGPQDGSVKLFMGRRDGTGKIEVVMDSPHKTEILKGVVHGNEKGTDTAKLWAHQVLNQSEWRHNADVLKFSLKYQIPSSQTALLAVPNEQMKLFREKAAEYQRLQREKARQSREWQKKQELNWNRSSGGDPEVRAQMPEAIKVEAILPDGRKFSLKKDTQGFWGGNFDIPVDAPEGDYVVTLVGTKSDGSTFEHLIHYNVDRTPPTGEISVENGFYLVKPNKPLAKAVAVLGSGTEENLVPTADGKYEFPVSKGRLVKVVLVDLAHNIREIPWSR